VGGSAAALTPCPGPLAGLAVKRAALLAPLRNKGFRLLVGGQMASNLGDAFYSVALPWYVLANHGSAVLLGTVLAAYGVPRTVLMAVGGHASDRWRPWTVMMACDSLRAVAVAALAVTTASGRAHPAVLVAVAVVLGAGEGIFLPGAMSIIPALLPDQKLQAGNSLSMGGNQLSFLLGPALGGAFVALIGPSSAFGVDAVSFLVSAATLARIKVSVTHGPGPAGPDDAGKAQEWEARASEDGVGRRQTLGSLLRSERVLQVTLAVIIAANLGMGGLYNVALPALAHGPFHAGAAGYGALLAAISAGSLAGTLVAGQKARFHQPAIAASAAFLGGSCFTAIAPYLGSVWATGVTLAIGDGFYSCGNLVFVTVMQRWAPPQLLGRIMGLLLTGSFAAYPVSVALGGVMVRSFGPAPLFPAAAGILVLALLGGLAQRSWRDFSGAGPAGSSQVAPSRGTAALSPPEHDDGP
jgi:predicted MFS family arabinose efflux permease